ARAFEELQVMEDIGDERVPVIISGEAASVISEAQVYRTAVVERVRAEADRFTNLLPQYKSNPRIVTTRLWQDAVEQIMTGDVETLYVPEGRHYLEINRDPDVQKRREEQRLAEEEAARRGGR
ncbi:MAG: hypothetical protein R3336_02240, partial [Phycisphaeraceae bacterium]|nr:hypothetical protein [Phycisphaeraceae bacterium]